MLLHSRLHYSPSNEIIYLHMAPQGHREPSVNPLPGITIEVKTLCNTIPALSPSLHNYAIAHTQPHKHIFSYKNIYIHAAQNSLSPLPPSLPHCLSLCLSLSLSLNLSISQSLPLSLSLSLSPNSLAQSWRKTNLHANNRPELTQSQPSKIVPDRPQQICKQKILCVTHLLSAALLLFSVIIDKNFRLGNNIPTPSPSLHNYAITHTQPHKHIYSHTKTYTQIRIRNIHPHTHVYTHTERKRRKRA